MLTAECLVFKDSFPAAWAAELGPKAKLYRFLFALSRITTMWSPQSEKFLLEQSRKFLLTRGQETECQRNRRRSIRRNGTGCTRPSVNRSHRESNAVWDKVMCGLFDPQLWGGGEGIPASVRGGEIGGERELHCRQPGKTASIAGTAPG